VKALVAASQEDTATGGPDLRRGIYPTVLRISSAGVEELADSVVGPLAEEAVDQIR
jgi:proteasome beta subunit